MSRETVPADEVARVMWVHDVVDGTTTREWAEAAWEDMGGSEPSWERGEYELRARAILDRFHVTRRAEQ